MSILSTNNFQNISVLNSKKTALVVEDNYAQLKLLNLMLQKLNINAVSALTGEKAQELMKGKSVDFMLFDIALGSGITGLTLMEEFRKEKKFASIPIIAVTASWSGELEKLKERGFTDYLAKPYRFEELKELLAKYLDI